VLRKNNGMPFLVGRKTYKKAAKSLEVLNNIACPLPLSYSQLSTLNHVFPFIVANPADERWRSGR
jgi:hypothetical protein